jgi:hypothetical protein
LLKIYWATAFIVGATAIVGGYGGARVAQKLPSAWMRGFVIVVGMTMTIYFFLRVKKVSSKTAAGVNQLAGKPARWLEARKATMAAISSG